MKSRHQERLLEAKVSGETRPTSFSGFESSYTPWLDNEFVKSHFIEDTRKWEHIPMDEVIVFKGSSCGKSESIEDVMYNIELQTLATNYAFGMMFKSESQIVREWENLWNRTKRDQEGFNLYMEDLKSKYPDWRNI